jgi:CRP-like cAMP-binding protein
MENLNRYAPVLEKSPLFSGVSRQDLFSILGCLDPVLKKYPKNNYILLLGESISHIGIVLKGTVQLFKESQEGNKNILLTLHPGELFLEAQVCAGLEQSGVTIYAKTDAAVLWIDFHHIMKNCSSLCGFHTKVIENMVGTIARKNLELNQKLEILSQNTIREKLLTYLSKEQEKQKTNPFTIPYNRNELAEYLSVNRSALSRELSALQKEGLLTYHKDQFQLYFLP